MAWPAVLARVAGTVGRGATKWGGRGLRFGGEALPAGAGAKKLSDQLGTVQDQISVYVEGGPRSDMKALFRLAASIAFGKVKRLVPAGGRFNPLPPPGAIGVKYDLTVRAVIFTLRFSRSIMTISTLGDGVEGLNAIPAFGGPSLETVGGDFDFKPPTPPFFPRVKPPDLEFKDKTILTTVENSPDPDPTVPGPGANGPTKNPRPQGDARGRGSLVRMVTAALASPAETGPATFELPTDANRFTGG